MDILVLVDEHGVPLIFLFFSRNFNPKGLPLLSHRFNSSLLFITPRIPHSPLLSCLMYNEMEK